MPYGFHRWSWLIRVSPGSRSIGIEITDNRVSFVETVLKQGGLSQIIRFGSEMLPPGAVEEGRVIESAAVSQTLRTLVQRSGAIAKQVHVALPSALAMVRFLKLPDVPLSDMRKIVDFELQYRLPLPFDEPHYDFIKLNGTNDRKGRKPVRKAKPWKQNNEESADAGAEDLWSRELAGARKEAAAAEQTDRTCDVMVVAAHRPIIDEYAEAISNAGLEPLSIEIKAFSLLRIAERSLRPADQTGTFVIVDVNDTDSDISIFHNGQLKITRNIQVRFPAEAQQVSGASNLSAEDDWFGPVPTGVNGEFLFSGACDELANELERLLNFYRYSLGHRDHDFSCLFFSGGQARLHELAERVRGRLSIRVELLDAGRLVSMPSELASQFHAFAVPYGLSLRGRQR